MARLQRRLTLYGLTMIAIGSCIGSGIFMTPSHVAAHLYDPKLILLVWFLGGSVSMLGALIFSELGAMFPRAGGVYIYIKEAYGPLAGFLYGWIILLIVNTGAMAALSMAFAEFLGFFFEIQGFTKQIVAVILVLSLTGVNIFGVNISQILASFFSGIKIVAIFILLGIGMIYGDWNMHESSLVALDYPAFSINAFLLAFVGVFWSFGGWHHATYLSGEVVDAQRNVPRAMIIGTMSVTALYLLANLAYFFLLPMPELIASEKVAGDAISAVFHNGGKLVSMLVICSVFGTIAIYTMTAPRIYYAMAEDKVFFNFLAKVHPKYDTPHYAMIFQAIWASLLILLWGSFIRIITFVTFMDIVFMMVAASTIFVFRMKRPHENRPYRVLAYPFLPILYVFVTAAFVFNLLWDLSAESCIGVVILLQGIPTYFFFKYNRK